MAKVASSRTPAFLAVTLMALLGAAVAIISPCDPSITTRCPKTGGQYYAYCIQGARGGPGGGCRNVEKFGSFPQADCSQQCIAPANDAVFEKVYVLDVELEEVAVLPTGLDPTYGQHTNQLCVQSCKAILTYPDLSIATGASAGLALIINGQHEDRLDYWLDAAQSMPRSLATCFQPQASLPKQCTNVRLPLPSCERKCATDVIIGRAYSGDTVKATAFDFDVTQYSVDGTMQLLIYTSSRYQDDSMVRY